MDETILTFKPVKLKQYPAIQERESREAKYWKKFRISSETRFPGAPNCIDFNQSDQTSYMVTGSTRVSLFGKNDKIIRTYSRFNDEAFSGKFRKDGTLLLAGDKAGYVRVFDVKTKAVLRNIKRHAAAVRATIWGTNALHFLSGSDDASVKLWDLPSQEVIWSTEGSEGHTDYVRCLACNPSLPQLFASGSYDHTVRLWDSRQSGETLRLGHSYPVESCLFAPSGTLLFAAAGNEVKVWDVVAGKHLHSFISHQKNITGLVIDSSATRLISCGLDGHVKIYDLQLLQFIHGIKYGAPVLSVALSPESNKLIVGHVDGTLITRIKQNKGVGGKSDGADEAETEDVGRSNAKKFYKGAGNAVAKTEDAMIDTERKVRLKPYEKHLKSFSYQKALDAALKTLNPVIVITILEELLRRSGLTIALSGRNDESLEPMLAFTAKYVSHPRYSKLIIQVAHRIVDLYAGVLGRSDSIDELFVKLHRQVKSEISFQRQAQRVVASLDGIISAAILSKEIGGS